MYDDWHLAIKQIGPSLTGFSVLVDDTKVVNDDFRGFGPSTDGERYLAVLI
jgi:hypothetical protein